MFLRGNCVVLLPLPKKKVSQSGTFFFWIRGQRNLNLRHAACRASSPKRCRWQMKRGEDGAAVKICRRSKPRQILGTARGQLCRPSAPAKSKSTTSVVLLLLVSGQRNLKSRHAAFRAKSRLRLGLLSAHSLYGVPAKRMSSCFKPVFHGLATFKTAF